MRKKGLLSGSYPFERLFCKEVAQVASDSPSAWTHGMPSAANKSFAKAPKRDSHLKQGCFYLGLKAFSRPLFPFKGFICGLESLLKTTKTTLQACKGLHQRADLLRDEFLAAQLIRNGRLPRLQIRVSYPFSKRPF